ncbi:MAG: hypothetical protein WCN95_14295 [bacterium]
MLKSLDKWFPDYVRSILRRSGRIPGPRHLLFCIADHFEPYRRVVCSDGQVRDASAKEAGGLVDAWADRYPASVAEFRDADGRAPCHTFFYPQEEYDPACLDRLARLCERGYGEVEVHLHHRNDTAAGLREKLVLFRDTLRTAHGLLGTWGGRRVGRVPGSIAYGFVHGNWALCNSRPDGDWCGVNEELGILSDTGCYADLTFPSAPSPTQPRMVNSIYRAVDTPGRPRGCDRGERVEVRGMLKECGLLTVDCGQRSTGRNTEHQTLNTSPLLLITGPLGLNWRNRKWGILPRMENSEVTATSRPTIVRADLWVRQDIHVAGRPEWVFVKVHTHGCVEANREVLLGEDMRRLRQHLQSSYNDGKNWQLHYVSAREMYNVVRAAEDGLMGNPGEYRDYEVAPPPRC